MAAIFLVIALLVTLSSAVLIPQNAVVHHGTPVDAVEPEPHQNVHRSFSIANIQVRDFSLTSCGPSDLVQVKELSLTPDLKLNLDVEIKKSLDPTAPISVDVDVQKQFPIIGWKSVHSRHVADACSMAKKFEDKCTSNSFVRENNLPCSCPAPAGEYKLKDMDIKQMVLEAKQQRSFGSMLAGGRYYAKVVMKQENKVIACATVNLNVSL